MKGPDNISQFSGPGLTVAMAEQHIRSKYGKINSPMHNGFLMWEAWSRSHGILQRVPRAGQSESGENGASS